MKRTFLKIFSLAALALALAPTTALRADDDDAPRCSARSLRGAYGYTVRGTAPSNVQFAAVGRIEFNGQGQVTTVRTLSNGGAVVRGDAGSGAYTVGSDCRGTFTIGAAGVGQLQVDMVVAGGGKEIRGIVTNPGFVLTLEGTRQ